MSLILVKNLELESMFHKVIIYINLLESTDGVY